MNQILTILPPMLRRILAGVSSEQLKKIEEIRLREARALQMETNEGSYFLTDSGKLTQDFRMAYIVSKEDCRQLINMLTQHSLYSFEEEIKHGYITVAGGHRVGIAGEIITQNGKVKQMKHISCFNIRFAKPIHHVSHPLLPYLRDHVQATVYNTLIISPPRHGKTTLLRDLARTLSNGNNGQGMQTGLKVGIVDERSEIGACVKGIPTFDVGARTDVLDRCPKAEGMMMLIRSMSPEVLIVDEIGRKEDVDALFEALHAGIRMIATIHGNQINQVQKRLCFHHPLMGEFFERYVLLKREATKLQFRVYDQKGNLLKSLLQKKESDFDAPIIR
ncbi:stage III sporulation protein AA [Longirhabdus pacifica]|uniref:stage III sporulation protein AA n=1 Tax=Longirhabdus pacifica TaxID=2305227 RepID=UPI0013E8B506|nr:stage III sporulation protein AA [Longirhabdus pacifica]